MSENKWRSTADKLKEKLSFLKVGEESDEEDGDWQAGETSQTTEDTLPAGELTQKPAWSRKRTMHRGLFLFLLAAAAAGGFFLYNQFYVFRDYTIAESKKIEISAGTQYESVGKKLYRYNSDGVSCISRKMKCSGA